MRRSVMRMTFGLPKMASGSILTDIGIIYRRLLNHRPVIQNEVQYFVKEFETKHGDSGLQVLQTCMNMADEIDGVFLPEITSCMPQFVQIRSQVNVISELCNDVLSKEHKNLAISDEEQQTLDAKVEELRQSLQLEREAMEVKHTADMEKLQAELSAAKATGMRLRSVSFGGSSASLSKTSTSSGDRIDPEEVEEEERGGEVKEEKEEEKEEAEEEEKKEEEDQGEKNKSQDDAS